MINEEAPSLYLKFFILQELALFAEVAEARPLSYRPPDSDKLN